MCTLFHLQVGVTEEGKLNGVKVTYYNDCGCSPNHQIIGLVGRFADNSIYYNAYTNSVYITIHMHMHIILGR